MHSARYAGEGATSEQLIAKLLRELDNADAETRKARFACVLVLCSPEGNFIPFEGKCEGRIAVAAVGENGFGYDPVFIPEGYEQSFGELDNGIKAKLSHRAHACELLLAHLKGL